MIYRLPLLRSRHELDSWASREAAFLANNWILLFSAFFVLFATMFPTLSEAITGDRLTVGPPFFNKWMLPIGLMLLLLTGIGPLLAWRKSTGRRTSCEQFMWPSLVAVGTAAASLRVRHPRVGLGHLLRAVRVRDDDDCAGVHPRRAVRRARPVPDFLTALIGLVAARKRRYGGYIVHVGMVLIFLGFAGEGFKQEEQALLKPGQQVSVGHFTIRHDALRVTNDAQKQMITGHVERLRERQGDRADAAGEVVLQQA